MVGMGYNLEEIQESLAKMKYDEITATYLLLGRKAIEVQTAVITVSVERTVGVGFPPSLLMCIGDYRLGCGFEGK